MIDEVRERNQDTPPEVIEAEVEECVREARLTRRTLEQTDAGENLVHCKDGDDLFRRLGI